MLLKGKPTQISEEIELPDIAELISYPSFQDIDVDDVWTYGTDFHRKLISMSPISDKKKHITVHSGVKILMPGYRSCTGGDALLKGEGEYEYDVDREWHIDFEGKVDNLDMCYWDDRDIVTLLTNKTSAMTQFNEKDIYLKIKPENISSEEFFDFITLNFKKGNPLGINPWTMPANRLVTFTNHLHRATKPDKIEFRYMFRLLQSDRPDCRRKHDPSIPNISTIMRGMNPVPAIEKNDGEIKVYFPERYKDFYKNYEYQEVPKKLLQEKIANQEHLQPGPADSLIEKFKNYDFFIENIINKPESSCSSNESPRYLIKSLAIQEINFNNNYIELVSSDSFIGEKEYMIKEFFNLSDKNIIFIREDGEYLSTKIEKYFVDKDKSGLILSVTNLEKLISGMRYFISTDKNREPGIHMNGKNYFIK